MSEFPESGTGSWEEWRERAKKWGAVAAAIDNGQAPWDGPWWGEHRGHIPPLRCTEHIDHLYVARAVAERRAG